MAISRISMGVKSSTLLLALACLTCLLPSPVQAASDIVVGDENGWKNNKFDYTKWAASKTFRLGDTLVFNYASGAHDVYMVGGADFNSCSTASSMGSYSSGADRVPLNMTGKMWFLCSIGEHCADGMKFKITVLEANAATPADPPVLPTPGAAPSVASAASALVVVMLAFIGIFLG